MDLILNWKDRNLWYAASTILFSPFFWNVVARWEYKTKKLSITIGSAKKACILLAVAIIALGILRDWTFGEAIKSQPRLPLLQQLWISLFGYFLISLGTFLVLSSFFSLGFFGTFLGDYFGILMDERVTGFPFNIMNNPMYWGSSLNFLGYAIVLASPVGIVLSALVAVMYKIALIYEDDFTNKIYNQRDNDRKLV